MSSRTSSRLRKDFVRYLELVGPKEFSERTGIPLEWFYNIRYDIERGRSSGQQAVERYEQELYAAAGEHIKELQRLRRRFKPKRRDEQ